MNRYKSGNFGIEEIAARCLLTAASEAGTAEAKRPMDGWGRRGLKRCGEKTPCRNLGFDNKLLKTQVLQLKIRQIGGDVHVLGAVHEQVVQQYDG